MKIVLTSYSFAPAARQIDFSGFSGFDPRRLLAVVHAPTGRMIYAAGTPALGYTALAGSLLTLAFDTAAMGAADPLTVLYERPTGSTGSDHSATPAAVAGVALLTIPANPSRAYLEVQN